MFYLISLVVIGAKFRKGNISGTELPKASDYQVSFEVRPDGAQLLESGAHVPSRVGAAIVAEGMISGFSNAESEPSARGAESAQSGNGSAVTKAAPLRAKAAEAPLDVEASPHSASDPPSKAVHVQQIETVAEGVAIAPAASLIAESAQTQEAQKAATGLTDPDFEMHHDDGSQRLRNTSLKSFAETKGRGSPDGPAGEAKLLYIIIGLLVGIVVVLAILAFLFWRRRAEAPRRPSVYFEESSPRTPGLPFRLNRIMTSSGLIGSRAPTSQSPSSRSRGTSSRFSAAEAETVG